MNSTLYILTLFLLLQSGFGSDVEFGDDNTQYVKANEVNVLALSYSQSNFNHSIGIGIKAINQHSTIRNFQITPLNFDIQTNDVYNERKNSYSYLLSTINLVYFGLTVLNYDYIKRKNEDLLPYIEGTIIALSAINNSKVGLTLLYIETSENSLFNSSIFIKSKLDYFDGSNVNWWRWKPGFGVELDFVSGKKYSNGGYHGGGIFHLRKSYGISLELGLEKPIDFGVANPQSHKLTPYVNFILMKGF